MSNDNNALFSAQPVVNANGRLNYTPAANANGSATVTVRIHDNGGTMPGVDTSAPQTFGITVTPVNDAPTLANPGNKSVAEFTALNFTLVGADSDAGQTLTYRISSGLLTGMNLDAATGTFSWTPSEEQGPGTYPVTFRVTDNGTPQLFGERQISIAVTEANRAPSLFQPPTAAFYYEGFPIAFRLVGIDPDLPANKLTYSFANGKQAGMILDSATADFNWTPSETQGPGPYQVTFRVIDNGIPALSGNLTMTITVAEVNQSPILTNPGNQTAKKNKNLKFTLKATDPDVPANTLTFGISSGYPGMTLNGANFSWTPTSTGTFNNVTFYVMDNGTPVLSSYQSITITVTP